MHEVPDAPAAERANIGRLPLVVFVLLLLVPLLNFEFTYYQVTLKLFVFQTATTVLWCGLLWEAACGRLKAADWPAWWLFAPVAAWVAWGAFTTLWSPQPWLGVTWVVQDFYGLMGAMGLAVLLRSREARGMFVMASGVVMLVVAVLVFFSLGAANSTYFGDKDVGAKDMTAAFLLLPTLVAAAALYGQRAAGETPDDEHDYLRVLGVALLLLVFLGVGLRLGIAPGADAAAGPTPRMELLAWLFGLGAGVAVALWLLAPKLQQGRLWRVAAFGLAAVVVMAFVQREMKLAPLAARIHSSHRTVRYALFDQYERQMIAEGSLARRLAGNGAGTFAVAFDTYRPPESYAMRHPYRTDVMVQLHARRFITEVLFERGFIGVGLLLAGGLACVAMGCLAMRRARDAQDGALGVGIAAGVVGLAVLACLSKGPASFGASYAFWVALGLLGALSIEYGRATGLARSQEEALARGRRSTNLLGLAVAGVAVAVVAGWFLLALRPMLAEYNLRDSEGEFEAAVQQRRADIERLKLELAKGETPTGRVSKEFVENTRTYLDRAASMSLGGRVWLQAELKRAECDTEFGRPREAVERYQRLEKLYGRKYSILTFREGEAWAKQGLWEQAHELYREYALKNPLAAPGALMRAGINLYGVWTQAIETERLAGGPTWEAWAQELIDAATRGLVVDIDRYTLRMERSNMLYRLRRFEDAAGDMFDAASYIENVLAQRVLPDHLRAYVLMELAKAYVQWDAERTLRIANYVRNMTIDVRHPHYDRIRLNIDSLQRHFAPPQSPKKPDPPAEGTGGPTTVPKAEERPK